MVLIETDNSDTYGAAPAPLLERVQVAVAELAEEFTNQFYKVLADTSQMSEALARLTDEEYTHLKLLQAQHLRMLISPSLTEEKHKATAGRVGTAHALSGIDVLWLIESSSLYLKQVQSLIYPLISEPLEREQLLRVVTRRLLLDIEAQVSSYRRIEMATDKAVTALDEQVLNAGNLPDLVRGTMEVIGGLEGGISILFARADENGDLQVEASFGRSGEAYHHAMESGTIPKVSIDSSISAGQAAGGHAWRGGQIVIVDSWHRASTNAPWKAVGTQLGFRASAAVPILDAMGTSIGLFSIYSSYPGHFSSPRMRSFLAHVQRVVGRGIQQLSHALVIPLREQQIYRQLIEERRLVMLYQPIIDLHCGKLCRLEALARLDGGESELIAPDRFLPAFGENELLRLFEHGLKQVCADAKSLEDAGLRTQFSINLPASGLSDIRYEQILFRTIAQGGMPAQMLQLEVLETEESGKAEQAIAFVRRVRAAGIRVAQDDLGSGHSSLLRLDKYGFDHVKIDQGLVRGALHKPQRSLEFILYLTRLAHAFQTPVTVEGLENLGMLEAAAILGADYGQGYGIARPMRASEVLAWQSGFNYGVTSSPPKTALGALASYLLWDMQLAVMTDGPGLTEVWPGVQGISEQFVPVKQQDSSPQRSEFREPVRFGINSSVNREGRANERARVIKHLTESWIEEQRT